MRYATSAIVFFLISICGLAKPVYSSEPSAVWQQSEMNENYMRGLTKWDCVEKTKATFIAGCSKSEKCSVTMSGLFGDCLTYAEGSVEAFCQKYAKWRMQACWKNELDGRACSFFEIGERSLCGQLAGTLQSEASTKPENRQEDNGQAITSKGLAVAQDPPKFSRAPTDDEVQAALTAWRLAWEARDIVKYMQFYHADFAGRENFERQKKSVMARSKKIEVTLDNIKVTEESGRVRVVFLQTYRSDTYQSKDTKAQVWVLGSQGPQILSEAQLR